VLLWLITFYIAIGLIDAIRSIASRARAAVAPDRARDDLAGS
jgi:hypothetical protein